jgi:CO/xanthine dehydrogenase FAD-binding subunit
MTVLQPGDLLTSIRIPGTWAGAASISRKSAIAGLGLRAVSVASAMVTTAEHHRAYAPRRSTAWRRGRCVCMAVEQFVQGKPRNEATRLMAGNLAIEGAQPLQFNAYKGAA